MQEIKVGDIVRIVKVGSCLKNYKGIEIGDFCRVVEVNIPAFDIIDSNDELWTAYTDDYVLGYGIQIEKVEDEKPFRMPTTSIRMWHKGEWRNCTSEDVELTWDHF